MISVMVSLLLRMHPNVRKKVNVTFSLSNRQSSNFTGPMVRKLLNLTEYVPLKALNSPQLSEQRPKVPSTRPKLNIRVLRRCDDVPSRTLSIVSLEESSSNELTLLYIIGTTMTASAPPSPCVDVVPELSTLVIEVVSAAAKLTLPHRLIGFGQTVTVFPEVSDTIAVDTRSPVSPLVPPAPLELNTEEDVSTTLLTPVVVVGSRLGRLC